MAVKNALADYLDKISEEIHSKEIQPDEFTVRILMAGRSISKETATRTLNKMVEKGELVSRWGIINGKRGRIYKRK